MDTPGGKHYIANIDGTGVVQITERTEASDSGAFWSPDGQHIAFVSLRDGDHEIYLISPDGTGATRLTNKIGSDVRPAWSPDGKHLAFESLDGISIVGIDGSGPALLDSHSSFTKPQWSPDGRRIAFVSISQMGESDIFVVNSDGTGLINLTEDIRNDVYEPSWSPDGSQIVFVVSDITGARGFKGSSDIYLMSADGSDKSRLTISPWDEDFPTWLTGGDIAFTSNFEGDFDLWLMKPDRSDLRVLYNPGYDDYFYALSPDGRSVLINFFQGYDPGTYWANVDSFQPVESGPVLQLTACRICPGTQLTVLCQDWSWSGR